MAGPIIGYKRISENPFTLTQGLIYKFGPKICLFLLDFTRILLFFWGLGLILFDIPKNAFFLEILVLSNTFGFPAVNWAPK